MPPSRKYEDHGGPGIIDIMGLLDASDHPDIDRAMLMKSLIAFWVIGATYGHAKNFSISLHSGGRFSAAPIYDVFSAEPSLAAHQINRRQMRLAMAVRNRRRYRLDEIAPRHLVQTAVRAGYDAMATAQIIAEIGASAEAAFNAAVAQMPNDITAELVEPIGAAIRRRVEM